MTFRVLSFNFMFDFQVIQNKREEFQIEKISKIEVDTQYGRYSIVYTS